MTLRLGVFVAPDASHPDATVEAKLAADRAGLDLVGVQDHPLVVYLSAGLSLILAFIGVKLVLTTANRAPGRADDE